jgi:Fe-S cluster assembly ATPase SufC
VVEVLNFREVTVLRGGRPIVDRLDWVVTEDQRWVVLGPNGAGKTTILQLAGAQIHPTSGRVEVLGEALGAVDVFDLRPRIGLPADKLRKIDDARAAHLATAEDLREGIHLVSYGGQDPERTYDKLLDEAFEQILAEIDTAGNGLETAHDTDNGLEAVAADMRDGRQIDNQVSGSVIRRGLHQCMQFTGHFLVDVSLRTKDGNGSMAFYGYRHGGVVSLARDDCRHAVMKVHSNSI